MLNTKNIGKQLKELRKARGWRQLEVADKVGLSRSAVSNIESGKRALTISTLKRFCEVYSVDVSYFDIDIDNFDEAVDLTTKLEKIFKSEHISDEKKDEIVRDIMRIYVENRK